MTLTDLTDDLLFEIVGGLKIEDVIRLGAASGRLRHVDLPHGVGWERDDRRDAKDTAFVALEAMRKIGVPVYAESLRYRHWGPWLVTDAYRN